LFENVVTEDVLAKAFKSALGESALLVHLLLGLFRDGFEDLFLEGVYEVVAFFFRMLLGVYRIVEAVTVFFLEILPVSTKHYRISRKNTVTASTMR